jgi:hypothetical protein
MRVKLLTQFYLINEGDLLTNIRTVDLQEKGELFAQ